MSEPEQRAPPPPPRLMASPTTCVSVRSTVPPSMSCRLERSVFTSPPAGAASSQASKERQTKPTANCFICFIATGPVHACANAGLFFWFRSSIGLLCRPVRGSVRRLVTRFAIGQTRPQRFYQDRSMRCVTAELSVAVNTMAPAAPVRSPRDRYSASTSNRKLRRPQAAEEGVARHSLGLLASNHPPRLLHAPASVLPWTHRSRLSPSGARLFGRRLATRLAQTLKRKWRMSPSLTTYSLPSARSRPA